jgi:hypothetical protein
MTALLVHFACLLLAIRPTGSIVVPNQSQPGSHFQEPLSFNEVSSDSRTMTKIDESCVSIVCIASFIDCYPSNGLKFSAKPFRKHFQELFSLPRILNILTSRLCTFLNNKQWYSRAVSFSL